MRKADLISAIVGEQGGEPEAAEAEPEVVGEPAARSAVDARRARARARSAGPTDEPPVSDEDSR